MRKNLVCGSTQYIKLHGKCDKEVMYYIDGKSYTREEYEDFVKEKSEDIGENLAITIMVVSYLLMPVLLVLIGGR